jgi:hypothetical protein
VCNYGHCLYVRYTRAHGRLRHVMPLVASVDHRPHHNSAVTGSCYVAPLKWALQLEPLDQCT